ncbi:solute carrier family 25 (peroxisomal adenine nucleotide transporter), member 17 [Marchantia polymorpha subsp. ruderalis]|nr:hypothetical protein MARPO_0008s0075 [Marchantia polymorpha]BBN19526.1 hypothetical protein Mp_8g11410 [Marchantia polymorpha subsp. ruderalis]|eukprot:PTQ47298.1 hypothetical protein MARPO_0008s0075 [Marchantia polymorpha]
MSDAVVNGLAGAGGGIVAQLLTYPLQAVNTRQQTERKAKKGLTRDGVVTVPSEESKRQSRGTMNELWKVVRQEGWGGLYRGLSPSLIGTACSQGVYYYFYQLFKNEAEARSIRRKQRGVGDGSVGMFTSLIVAALAGCVNVLMTNPIWVIVTRMQTQNQAQQFSKLVGKSASTDLSNASPSTGSREAPPILTSRPVSQGALATVRELYEEAGVVGFWKGVLPTLIMVSNPAIQFMLYETLLKWLTKKRPLKKNGLKHTTATEVFAIASVAKLGATVVTYPLLVVKSRLQAKQEIGGDKALQYSGTADAIVKMVRYEGILGFYKGMSTKIVQSVVAAAVLFMIKEELVKGARALVTKRDDLAKAVRIVDMKKK